MWHIDYRTCMVTEEGVSECLRSAQAGCGELILGEEDWKSEVLFVCVSAMDGAKPKTQPGLPQGPREVETH